jgi:hypothetical protein
MNNDNDKRNPYWHIHMYIWKVLKCGAGEG